MSSDVKWIKLTTSMFDNRKIKHLRKLPEGNNIVLIWVMLLTMAGRCNSNGFIFLTENIPYTPKMLSDELGFDENVIQVALSALEKFEMIRRDGEFLSIPGWEEHQNAEGLEKIREQTRKRMVDYRARKREGITSVGENCVYCGKPANTVDHLIPKSKGGPDKSWNLVPCCRNCNSSKHDKNLADFLNDSFVYDYQNVNHELVRSNEKIMAIVDFENGKYMQRNALRNSYGDVTNQNKNKEIDKEKEVEIDINTPPIPPSKEGESGKGSVKKKEPVVYYPDDEMLDSAFKEFLTMRKQIKKPLATKQALTRMKNKIERLSGGNSDLAIQILNQSTDNCWQDVYELKDGRHKRSFSNAGERDILNEWRNS